MVAGAGSGFARNVFVVESKTVLPYSQGVELGVHLENDIEYFTIDLPLEFRSLDSGSFMCHALDLTVQGRVAYSGLTGWQELYFAGAPDSLNSCSGPISSTFIIDSPLDFVSPDGVYWFGVDIGDSLPPLGAGTDGEPGSGMCQ